jgi:glutathionylspermidine synthase
MRRETTAPRPDIKARMQGISMWPADDDPYYDESVAYVFSESQIETLYEASVSLERMIGEAVDHVIAKKRFQELGISENLARYASECRRNGHPSVYGRMDLAYDGVQPPKLLEYNADTPTALFEAAVLQWEWLKAQFPASDQFNSIHEALIAAWAKLKTQSGLNRLTLTGMLDEDDDRMTIAYMEDVAHQAGWRTLPMQIEDLGFDGRGFVDSEGVYVQALFKLYPWDWLAQEKFFDHLVELDPAVMESAWRVIASSKGLLPILWELFPDHPNLLPASFKNDARLGPRVSKPVLGREGSDIQFIDMTDEPFAPTGPYERQKRIYQTYHPLPCFDGWYPVIGSWIIDGEPCGIGVREDRSRVTGPGAKFRPHRMED